jgi:hypothetical protein
VAHNVFTGELGYGYALHVLQNLHGMCDSTFMTLREINLRRIARDDCFAAKANATNKCMVVDATP